VLGCGRARCDLVAALTLSSHIRQEKKMIDDMEGLFSHASEAYRAGKRTGIDEFFRNVQGRLGQISVKYEQQQGDLATRGFHVAQECAKAVGDLKVVFDKPGSDGLSR
jgi:hypothetical protein